MTDYLLWAWGAKAPMPTKLVGHNDLNEFERKYALSEPIPLRPEDEGLDLNTLARLYPPPAKTEYPDTPKKVRQSKEE